MEKIIGWSVGPTLETTYPVKALKMALARIEGKSDLNLIHHSDRGSQYASYEYVNILQESGIRISMTETGDPKDNAQAERINNMMKNELLKGMRFTSIKEVEVAVVAAIDFYNNERPHMSLDMKTPAKASLCKSPSAGQTIGRKLSGQPWLHWIFLKKWFFRNLVEMSDTSMLD